MDYFNPAEAFKEGYAATEAVSSDIQSKDILRQAYADAPNTGSPQGDASVYNKAAQMAGMSGNASLAHTFQKQAGELSTSINKQKLDAITTSQTALEYATQQLPLASSIEDLNGIIDSTGVDPAMALKLRGAIKNLPLEQAKAVLKKVGTTVDTDLKTQKIALDGIIAQKKLDNIDTDNLRQSQAQALKVAGEVFKAGGKLTPNQEVLLGFREAPSGSTDNAPSTFLGGRGAVEAPSYDTVAVGGALGKYGIKPKTLDLARKLDPSLPADNKAFLADPKAQDRAALVLEKANEDEIKKSGNKVTQVNKDLFWRFGAPDGTKLLNAYDKNPNTKIEDVLGEQVIKENPDLSNKTVAQAIAGNVSVSKQPTSDKEETDPEITQQVRRINARATKKDQVNTGEAKTVFSQIDKKYWNNLDTPTAIKEASTTLGVVREADNIANFIKDNKVKTGSVGTLTKFLDKMNPNQSVSDAKTEIGKQSFSANEQILGKLVLDFANQYARSERGGSTPMATIAELKAALNSFGVDSMSPDSAVKSFKFIADHKKDKLAYTYFDGNSDAVKPRMYEGKKEAQPDAPKIGQVVSHKGAEYLYKGGNPSKETSWETM